MPSSRTVQIDKTLEPIDQHLPIGWTWTGHHVLDQQLCHWWVDGVYHRLGCEGEPVPVVASTLPQRNRKLGPSEHHLYRGIWCLRW